ncbi:hypothetical protein FAGKG844_230055 [Frankia sp. AgKG'84/4]
MVAVVAVVSAMSISPYAWVRNGEDDPPPADDPHLEKLTQPFHRVDRPNQPSPANLRRRMRESCKWCLGIGRTILLPRRNGCRRPLSGPGCGNCARSGR